MWQRAVITLLISLLLGGCVSQRYAGISITSTAPMRITKVMINGDAVVLCRVGP